MSLVDKLEGVHVGDILKLSNAELSVVGYVIDYSSQTIRLGHENPLDFKRWLKSSGKSSFRNPKGGKLLSGNRTYLLGDFDNYETLQKAKELQTAKE